MFKKKSKNEDNWNNFLEKNEDDSSKQKLLNECQRLNVCIYVDDVAESSSGVYSHLRGVASEAELERRLNSKIAVLQSRKSNRIALIALAISCLSLLVAIFL